MLMEASATLDLQVSDRAIDRAARRSVKALPSPRARCVDRRGELPARLAALTSMSRDELVLEWRRQYRANPPDRIRRELLELGIAWKLQEKALGGLKRAVATELRDLADALATTGDIRRVKSPKLKPGARLVREWGGITHEVTVTDGGFLWNDEVRESLSAIAEEITGTHWSGPRFFGLTSRARPTASINDGSASTNAEEDLDA